MNPKKHIADPLEFGFMEEVPKRDDRLPESVDCDPDIDANDTEEREP